VDADVRQLEAAAAIGADIVEIHTGRYCEVRGLARKDELLRIREAAYVAAKVGLECHAGHGLSYETVEAIAAIPNIVELNIGHFLIGEAVFAGLATAIKTMREHMDNGRAKAIAANV
jgi:pyridoxine 5-phosphate synthase